MTRLIRAVYFPDRGKDPHLLLVYEERNGEVKACTNEKDFNGGRFHWYKRSKCQPYSDELYSLVVSLLAQKKEIEEKLLKLRDKGKL